MNELNEIQIQELLAARFEEGGRGPNGFDCWGICEEVARRAGVKMISFERWVASISERDRIFRETTGSDQFERLSGPEPFCIVGFTNNRRTRVKHMGIVMADGRSFMHIRRKVGVSITRLNDEQYRDRIYGFFRYARQ